MIFRVAYYYSKELVVSLVISGILVLLSFIFVNNYRKVRRHESLAVFVLLVFATIPFNAVVSYLYYRVLRVFDGLYGAVIRIIFMILVYAILLSAEELVFGIIGRRIWKYQKDFFGDEKGVN